MSKEIELKLTLSSAQARRLVAHPVLAGGKPSRSRLYNTYYDTPDFALRQRGIALRLRRKGLANWVMTVKGGDSGPGGLAERSEWEAPTRPGHFDFSIVGDESLRAFLVALEASLRPVFTTDFSRTAWQMQRGGSLIELVLDRGTISCTASGESVRNEPLCEVELELVGNGSSDDLFDLAIELSAELHLHPEILSKAERGYALADGRVAAPFKGQQSPLLAMMPPVDAFRAIVLACLLQLQRNEAGVVCGGDPEYVHQARVAIRRLRSAFKLFAPLLSPAFVSVYLPRWRALAVRLGGARDWDVFLDETLRPLEEAFPGDADLALLRARGLAEQLAAQKAAAEAFSEREYSRLVLAFCAALLREPPATIARQPSERKFSGDDLMAFAQRRLRRLARAIAHLAANSGHMTDEERHRLRINFKRLRYALDFFAPILPRKRLVAYQGALVSIQDVLGALNDHATASRLIKAIHPKGEPQPLTRGWIAGRVEFLLADLNRELRRFLACRAPWR